MFVRAIACTLCPGNTTEKSGNRWLHQWGILLWETAREYFSEKIHRLDESVRWVSREQTSRSQAKLSMQFSRDTCTGKKQRQEEKEEEVEEREGGRKGEKKLFDAGSEALTYNRQGVDSRLLDLRQSNFANETYPVTQLVSTHARTHARN